MMQIQCPQCKVWNDPPKLLRLWDGRWHCLACVDTVCPGLSSFAAGRHCLEDSIPFDRAGGMLVWWKIAGLFFGVLALVSVGFVFVLDLQGTLLLVGAMVFCLLFAVLGSLPSVFNAKYVLPSVRVHDGVVEVFRPNHGQGKSPVTTYRLEEARWSVGKLQQDSSFQGRGGPIAPEQVVVLLQSPRRWAGVAPPSEFTAVGSTPEMVRIWKGFLKIAGVPEGK